MNKEYIEIKGVKFEKSKGCFFEFKKGCLITPMYKYGKIACILVTDKENGKTFYVESNTRILQFVNTNSIQSMKLPQGISYFINGESIMKVLTTWILIQQKK